MVLCSLNAGRQVNGCSGERGILGAGMNIPHGVSRKYAIPKKGYLIRLVLGAGVQKLVKHKAYEDICSDP